MSEDALLAVGFPAFLYSLDPANIEEVLDMLRAIDMSLKDDDGLKWWNLLYLITTEQVHEVPQDHWEDPAWLDQLDVNFARRYFQSLRQYYAGETVTSSAWRALLKARERGGVDRIQFALAGMNAHIDYDLAWALVKTNAQSNIVASSNSAQYRDYLKVNALFKILIPKTLAYVGTGLWGTAAELTGPIGRLAALLQIEQARQIAWDLSVKLPTMKPRRSQAVLRVQNVLTGSFSRFFLLPADPLKNRIAMRLVNFSGVQLVLRAPNKLADILIGRR